MKGHLLLPLFLSVALTPLGRAQHTEDNDFPCAGAAPNVPMAECLSDARKRADAALDEVYKKILRKINRDDAERLASTQRLWLRYRRMNCVAERELYQGGSESYPAYVACLEAMTRSRTQELQTTYGIKLK